MPPRKRHEKRPFTPKRDVVRNSNLPMLSSSGRSARALFASRSARLLCTGTAHRCPYAVLGVAPGATAVDIKTAYRREAMKHHPDRSQTNDSQRFIELAMAYSALSGAHQGNEKGGMTHEDAERILESIMDCRKVAEMLILEYLENTRKQHKDKRAFVPAQPRPAPGETSCETFSDSYTRLISRYPSVLPVMPLPPSKHGPMTRQQAAGPQMTTASTGARGSRRVDPTHVSSWIHLVQDAGPRPDGPSP